MTTLVYAALNHVRIFYPEITHVFYNDEGHGTTVTKNLKDL